MKIGEIKIDSGGEYVGSVAQLSCDDGFAIWDENETRKSEITCLPDGKWDADLDANCYETPKCPEPNRDVWICALSNKNRNGPKIFSKKWKFTNMKICKKGIQVLQRERFFYLAIFQKKVSKIFKKIFTMNIFFWKFLDIFFWKFLKLFFWNSKIFKKNIQKFSKKIFKNFQKNIRKFSNKNIRKFSNKKKYSKISKQKNIQKVSEKCFWQNVMILQLRAL